MKALIAISEALSLKKNEVIEKIKMWNKEKVYPISLIDIRIVNGEIVDNMIEVKKWCESIGMNPSINFVVLTASKEDCTVQKFVIGDEMLESGKFKFESVWNDIVTFVDTGEVEKEEIL